MLTKSEIYKILCNIRNNGYNCFVSEAQLRDVFAIELNKTFSNYQIFPEFTPWNNPSHFVFGNKKISFDLLAKSKEEKVAFEFKYKTRAFETVLFGEKIKLNNQEDTTNGRFDIWEDIYRLEQFVKDNQLKKGYLIFITNYPTYFAIPRPGTDSEPFSISKGEHIACTKEWPSCSKRTRDNNFTLDIQNNYYFDYSEYSQIDNEVFYLLLVEVL